MPGAILFGSPAATDMFTEKAPDRPPYREDQIFSSACGAVATQKDFASSISGHQAAFEVQKRPLLSHFGIKIP